MKLDESKGTDKRKSLEFDLNSLLGYRLIRLSSSLGALAEKTSKATAGLSLPEYRILAALFVLQPIGVVALEKEMRLDKAWISRVLSKLTEKKLVASVVDTNDARKLMFFLTALGEEIAEKLIERAVVRQQQVLDNLGLEDIEHLLRTLEQIQHNVDKLLM